MAASADVQLRRVLSDLGYEAGPVTDTTRPVYMKKLKELMDNNKKRNTRRSLPQKPLNTRSLLTFSSDESDPESTNEKSASRKIRRRSRQSLQPATESTSMGYLRGRNKHNNSSFSPTSFKNSPANNYNESPSRNSVLNFLDSSETDSDGINDINNFKDSHKNRFNLHSTPNHRFNSTFNCGLQETPRKDHATNNGSGDGLKHFYSADGLANNSSHFISMILLGIVVVFFLMLGVMYLSVRNKDGKELQTDIEDRTGKSCINKNDDVCDDKETLFVLNKLRNKLWKVAGAHDCSSAENSPRRNMALKEVRKYFKPYFTDREKHLIEVLQTCFRLFLEHPDLGIRLNTQSHEFLFDPTLVETKLDRVYWLESIAGEKSFFCRLSQAFGVVVYKLVTLAIVVTLIVIFVAVAYWYWRQKKEFQREVIEMTENIISLLQKNYESSLANSDVKPFVPVPHIRDALISISERKKKIALWETAMKFLQEHDSRVRLECQNVDGEDFQVLRWLQSPTPSRPQPPKKLWQGQAFESLDSGANAPPYSLTPCLKVRNMFDPDVEYGDDWHIHIQDAILDKCEGMDGIVHVKVDTSSREGCVYVKCSSPDAAGAVFRALHGWWFDGSLVTVRYLRLERYHERFPDSIYARHPLRSSTTKSTLTS